MATFSNVLMARGLQHLDKGFNKPRQDAFEVPNWIVPALVVTSIAFFLIASAIRYTYGLLVPALAMVEEPAQQIVITKFADADEPDAPLMSGEEKAPVEEELLVVKQKPITAKLHTTIRHLRQKGGRWARFRGLHLFLLLLLGQNLFVGFFMSMFWRHSYMSNAIIHVASAVVFCRLAMAWTHHVISMPRPTKTWYQRLADRQAAKHIVLPTLTYALAELAAHYVSVLAFNISGLPGVLNRMSMPARRADPSAGPFDELASSPYPLLSFLFVATVVVVAHLAIYFPALVMLVRSQAALLPEDEQAIVPFDRTFGGRVVPAAHGGNGRLTMREAWKSFDWNARVRLLKIYLKAQMLELFTTFAFFGTVALELHAAFGTENLVWLIQHGQKPNGSN